MNLLVILPGTPIDPAEAGDKELIELDTLSEGKQFFHKTELLNNLQSVAGLQSTGNIQISIRSCSQRRHPWQLWLAGRELQRLTRTIKPDLVYVFWGGLSGWVMTLFSKVKVVLCLLGSDLMGSYTLEGKKTNFGKMLAFFSGKACARAKGIVVMSEKMKQLIHKKQLQKVLVLPEGVDINKFYPKDKKACRQQLGWNETDAIVLFFSYGAFVKNTPLAMAAFQIVKERLPHARMMEVRNVPNSQLVNYYNAADLLLLTSFHEGSNNSIKEALACNCPVVTTDVGDARQRLDAVHPSFCVASYDAAVLAEKMISILANPQRSNGRANAEEVSIENIGKKLRAYLDGLINS